jgi:radical S-adenosyl methionine domain-containing protein 2
MRPPESNDIIRGSYLILDKYMRFLDKGDKEEKASKSILDISVRKVIT